MSIELNLTLPDNLAKEAAANGLLSQEAIEQLIRDEIERRNKENDEGSLSKITGRELFENLNAAYADEPEDEDEKNYRKQMKRHHLRMLEKLEEEAL